MKKSQMKNLVMFAKTTQQREREREREQIKAYFSKYNIKSIKLESNELVIEYNNSQAEQLNITEKQLIQSYCQRLGVNSLSLSDLQKTNTENKPTN
jgi:cytidylate kinase